MILITFAVPFESAGFRGRSASSERVVPDGIRCLHTGVGADQAHAAVHRELANSQYSGVIVAGFAGALSSDLPVGTLITSQDATWPPGVKMPRGTKVVRLMEVADVVSTAAAKAALWAQTGADAVDMESQTITAACQSAGVPCGVLRVISDGANQDLPLTPQILARAADGSVGGTLGIVAALAARPGSWRGFSHFVRDCRRAQQTLGEGLRQCLEKRD